MVSWVEHFVSFFSGFVTDVVPFSPQVNRLAAFR